VNNIVAAYDGYFRVTLMCSKGVAYFENLDIDIDRTETVVTNTIETDVLNSSDYYPFGLRMVKNSAPSTDYRYGYQGDFAEEDKETGFNHFQLRQYDPVIGRWLIPDPARQYHSPYLAFGNNPVNRVDPDGGTDGVINVNGGPCKCSQVVEGRQVTFNSKYLGNTDMTMNDFADMIAIINPRNEYSSLSWMYIEQHGESLVSGVGAMQVFDWVGHSHGQIEVGALFHVNPGGSFAKGFMGLATSLATYLGIPLDRNMYRETLILAPQPPNLIGEVDTVSDRITPGLFRKVHTKWLRTDGTFKDSISYPKPQVNWAQ
jgi:RHS repeat-associated protein